jgi:CSLREA domain-containing protein
VLDRYRKQAIGSIPMAGISAKTTEWCRNRRALSAVAVLACLAVPATAGAATITPDSFADDDADNGNCTLREAVIAANANAPEDGCDPGSGPSDTIPLAAGTYQLSVPGTDEDEAATGDLDLNDTVELAGAGSAQTIIDGGALDSVFHIDASGPADPAATISDLTIRNGRSTEMFEGAAITNQVEGHLTLLRSVITANTATLEFSAGAIRNANSSTATIEQTTITDNRLTGAASDFGAGGIANVNLAETVIRDSTIGANAVESEFSAGGLANLNIGIVTIERSTISGNTSASTGSERTAGGIVALNSAETTISDSTISGNSSATEGGGIALDNGAPVTLTSSTLARNTAGGAGGGIFDATNSPPDEPLVSVRSSIVAENTAAGASGANCAVDGATPLPRSDGHNLEDANTCGFTAPGDRANSPAALGPLAPNGGPTQTHLLNLSSAALDTGVANGLTVDQRGVARTADLAAFANGAGDGTDIGALEVQAALCRGINVPRIDGSAGPDALVGAGGAQAIFAGAGNDSLAAKGGNDCLFGEAGRDTAKGGGGKDELSGGGGRDKLKGGGGKDKIKTGGGKDKVNCGGGKDKVTAGRKDKVAGNCEKVV